MSLVEIHNLCVHLTDRSAEIVSDVNLAIEAGEIAGLVGESGSGKTTIGAALLGHARRGAAIVQGEVLIDGTDIVGLDPVRLRRLRGTQVAYVAQDPAAALNPSLRIGRQISEMIDVHERSAPSGATRERIRQVMREVNLPTNEAFLRRYVHELSGGQQQRLLLAMAFILRPRVIVLDEPTTGLDVTTQAHVLDTVRSLCADYGVAALYVSHDLAVVANLAHRIAVLYAGRVVEAGSRAEVLLRPSHPYTRELLKSTPDLAGRRRLTPIHGRPPALGARPSYCSFEPRCRYAVAACRNAEPPLLEVSAEHVTRCLRAYDLPPTGPESGVARPAFQGTGRDAILSLRGVDAWYGSTQVLHRVSFELEARECLALVGESGSGKTTIARSIVGAVASWTGDIAYAGEALPARARERSVSVRKELQYVFQSPYNSLNPRRCVGDAVAAPLEYLLGVKPREARRRVGPALERVALPSSVAARYPDELSGGERQRVAIARALVCEPRVLICDEVTSALDVSVQASIVQLLERLQREDGLATLFVTHNLALVRSIADRVAVLHDGVVVEAGPTEQVLDQAKAPYTRALVTNTPTLARSA